jgi:hypothetical protein
MAISSPRLSGRFNPLAPIDWAGNTEEWVRKVVDVVNRIMDGKINATGDLTLTANAASTALADMRITPNSCILLMPTTANAATALATTYVSARTEESATVTHANNAQTDRTFRYAILG